jgi:DNA-binding MarR family transcriptional regulator
MSSATYHPAAHQGPRDSVDRLLEGWARARPDLDLSPVAVIARLDRLRRIIDSELEATFAEHGLNGADFAALVTLRRLDRPGGVSQRRLMRELQLTSGTVSVRVERLSDQGLVTRAPDRRDRRNSLVRLTDKGRALFDRVTPAHVRTENRLLAALGSGQREQLVTILRQLLVSFEGSAAAGDLPRLGLTLAPAHVTVAMRRAVGLPEAVGLLVRQVEDGSRAALAGIRTGDVLMRAADRELRSVASLYAALDASAAAGTVTITVVRGVDAELEAVVDLRPRPAGEPAPPRGPGAVAADDAGVHTV